MLSKAGVRFVAATYLLPGSVDCCLASCLLWICSISGSCNRQPRHMLPHSKIICKVYISSIKLSKIAYLPQSSVKVLHYCIIESFQYATWYQKMQDILMKNSQTELQVMKTILITINRFPHLIVCPIRAICTL